MAPPTAKNVRARARSFAESVQARADELLEGIGKASPESADLEALEAALEALSEAAEEVACEAEE